MHALVIEGVIEFAEQLLIGFAPVEGGVVLPGHEANVLHLEAGGDLAELFHSLTPHTRVVRGVSQVAGEDDEIRRLFETVDGLDRLLQSPLRVRVDLGAVEAPVGVGELHEIEIFVTGQLRPVLHHCPECVEMEAGKEHDAAA